MPGASERVERRIGVAGATTGDPRQDLVRQRRRAGGVRCNGPQHPCWLGHRPRKLFERSGGSPADCLRRPRERKGSRPAGVRRRFARAAACFAATRILTAIFFAAGESLQCLARRGGVRRECAPDCPGRPVHEGRGRELVAASTALPATAAATSQGPCASTPQAQLRRRRVSPQRSRDCVRQLENTNMRYSADHFVAGRRRERPSPRGSSPASTDAPSASSSPSRRRARIDSAQPAADAALPSAHPHISRFWRVAAPARTESRQERQERSDFHRQPRSRSSQIQEIPVASCICELDLLL